MSGVDNRVVTMTFDNKVFQQKVGETIGSLDKLKEALKFDKAGKGLADISDAASKFNMNTMHTALDSINAKFLALSTVGVTALATLTSHAVDAGLRIAKSLTLDNAIAGFSEYETNINSIQTILANTASKGTSMDQVNAALQQLNKYSDETIFNFEEMTKNIGTFTAAGVDLDTSVSSIKGIANVAAMSGSNSEQAATAMYQLSQAIASGTVKAQDWISVTNAGMGGEALQTALFETAKAMGTLKDVPMGQTLKEWTTKNGSFKDSLKDGWLTAEVLTKTLGNFTGDVTKEMLMQQGFSEKIADQIFKTAQIAKNAATNVKTFTQLVDTTKQQIGTGWSDSFAIIIGNFEEARSLFTMISTSIGKVIGENNDARNQILSGWKAFGGRDAIIQGMVNTWVALGSVLRPIQEAFREVFPPTLAGNLVKLSAFIRDFTHSMIASGETGEKIKAIFKGIFSIFSIGIAVVKGIVHVFTSLVSALFGLSSGAGGGLLSIAAGIGEFVSWIRELLVTKGGIETFFNMLATVLTAPIHLLILVKDAVAGFVGGLIESLGGFGGIFSGAMSGIMAFKDAMISVFHALEPVFIAAGIWIMEFKDAVVELSADLIPPLNKLTAFLSGVAASIAGFFASLFGDAKSGGGDAAASSVDKVTKSIGGLSISFEWLNTVADALSSAWDWLIDRLGIFGDQLGDNMSDIGSLGETLAKAFGGIGKAIGDAFSNIKWDQVLEAAKVGLAGGLLVVINNVIKGMSFDQILTGGMFGKIGDAFSQLGSTLKAMQQNIKADALMKIAKAMAVLVIAMIALTFIDIADLGKALGAMAIGFAQLAAVMKVLDTITSSGKKMLALAAGVILLALSMGLLTMAVTAMAQLSWDELLIGLGGVAALLGMIIGLSHLMSKETDGMVKAGFAMIVMSLGLKALAWAMQSFSDLDWPTMLQGLAGTAAGLLMMSAAIAILPDDSLKKGISLLILSFAIGRIADAVSSFGAMDWETMKKGFLGVGIGLLLIAGAMKAFPDNMLEMAAGLLIVAIALRVVADTVEMMGVMDSDQLAQGLLALGAALLFISLAVMSMEASLPGAYAIAVTAAALFVLSQVIKTLGDMPIASLITALIGMAAVLALLAVAALLMVPAVPAMVLMGVALSAIGIGFALFGAGAYLVAQAFATLANVSATGAKNIVNAINTILEAIPGFAKRFADGIIGSMDSILMLVPRAQQVFEKVFEAIIDTMLKYIPKVVDVIIKLMEELLRAIREVIPDIVETGVAIILALLEGIRDNIDNIITVALEIVSNLVDSLMTAIPLLVTAGVKLLLALIQGIADNIQMIIDAGVNLLIQFLFGLTRDVILVAQAVGTVITALITAITAETIRIAQAGTDALIAFLAALTEDITRIATAITTMITTLITEIGNNARLIIDAGTDALINFLDGLIENIPEIGTHVQTLINTIFDTLLGLTATFTTKGAAFVLKFLQQCAAATVEIAQGARELLIAWLSAMSTEVIKLTRQLADVIIAFCNGLSAAIDAKDDEIGKAARKLANSIIDGIITAFGLGSVKSKIEDAVKAMLGPIWTLAMMAIGARSPSKLYMKLGGYIVDGLAIGISQSQPAVEATKSLMADTTSAFNEAMRQATFDIESMPEFNPTITPVLDLTQVMRDAKDLSSLALMAPMAADVSFKNARYISHTNDPGAVETVAQETAPTVVNFEQNNYSPSALSTNDIYRLTRSQIALAKEELKIP